MYPAIRHSEQLIEGHRTLSNGPVLCTERMVELNCHGFFL